MGFTLRFMLGTFLYLLFLWSNDATHLKRFVRQVNQDGDNKTATELQKNETETTTQQSVLEKLTNQSETKQKTDSSGEDKTVDKQNSINKLQNPQAFETTTDQVKEKKIRDEIGRSIDIEKYISKEFHSKNNVYKLPLSPDTEKYINHDYDFHHTTTRKHSGEFNFYTELTTPKSLIFDSKFKEAVESVDQKLEHIDDSDEFAEESESTENINLEALIDETKKNDTDANLLFINFKNIVSNSTGNTSGTHKDIMVESGTNLNFQNSYNHTTVVDDDSDNEDSAATKEPNNEKIVEVSTLSNVIPAKSDLENSESSTSKSTIIVTTKKSVTVTKPTSHNTLSYNSILNNTIETETVKAVNVIQSTERTEGQKEVIEEAAHIETPINVSKRPVTIVGNQSETERIIPNQIEKISEQQLDENQVVSVKLKIVDSSESDSLKQESTTVVDSNDTVTTVPVITTTEEFITITPVSTGSDSEISFSEENLQITTPPPHEKTTFPTETTTEISTNPSEAHPTEQTVVETITSIIIETSTTPWERVTTETTNTESNTDTTKELTTKTPEILTIQTFPTEAETATSSSSYQSDSTMRSNTEPIKNIDVTTTAEVTTSTITPTEITTALTEETAFTTPPSSEINHFVTNVSVTTNPTLRTSKGIDFTDSVGTVAPSTELATETQTVRVTTSRIEVPETEIAVTKVVTEKTRDKVEEPTFETRNTAASPSVRKLNVNTDPTTELENTTEVSIMTSGLYEHGNNDDNSGTIAAITISSVGAVCLVLLAGLLIIMRKRQKRFNYGQRCRPVNLDDYSMDNVSVYNSVRRKGAVRSSQRSYGNPAFEDPVCISHPLNFPALGKFANNLEDIKAEFEDIPQIIARMNELPEGCDTKNRYANVIPLPETRVFLSSIDGHPNSDYINANYVTGPKNIKGYYIACQAPMQNTVDDFWRMMWEQQSKVILMLTHLFENGVEKCVDYLPPSEVLDCHRLFGDFQVTLKKREVKDKYIISSLQLKNMVSNSWREVTHFWYLGWPEKGVPSEANSLIAFLIEARSYMKSSSLDRKEVTKNNLTNGVAKNEINPVVVHCSPGTGRTGVVIACDIAIREFEQNRLVDVPRIVYKIRRDRASAVQTKEQYAFIYKVINLYATKLTGGALDSL